MFYRPMRSCDGNTRVNVTEVDVGRYGVDSSGSEEGTWQVLLNSNFFLIFFY